MLTKHDLEQLKAQLLEEEKSLKEQLSQFAQKNPKAKGDWQTKFPQMDQGASDTSEESEDEVELFGSLVAVERTLETKLQKVQKALGKISRGKYGFCENCGDKIGLARLKADPSVETCAACKGDGAP